MAFAPEDLIAGAIYLTLFILLVPVQAVLFGMVFWKLWTRYRKARAWWDKAEEVFPADGVGRGDRIPGYVAVWNGDAPSGQAMQSREWVASVLEDGVLWRRRGWWPCSARCFFTPWECLPPPAPVRVPWYHRLNPWVPRRPAAIRPPGLPVTLLADMDLWRIFCVDTPDSPDDARWKRDRALLWRATVGVALVNGVILLLIHGLASGKRVPEFFVFGILLVLTAGIASAGLSLKRWHRLSCPALLIIWMMTVSWLAFLATVSEAVTDCVAVGAAVLIGYSLMSLPGLLARIWHGDPDLPRVS